MATLILRLIKGSPLTSAEMDANYTNLNDDIATKLPTASYTASDVLNKIKTVDGSGSGLDADLLDGLNADSANTVNTIVARDASGNFSANIITATLSGNVSGNATNVTGVVQVAHGGTGATTADDAPFAKKGNNTDITSMGNFSAGVITATFNGNLTGTSTNVTGIVAVGNGGTGASLAINAPFALKGTNSDITSLNSPSLGSATAVTQAATDVSTKVATTEQVRNAIIYGAYPGAVSFFATSTAPTGWLKANGASLSTTAYTDLFARIGYTFGGSGANFNLPDLRGEFLRSLDDGRGIDTGRGLGTWQEGTYVSDQAWQTITIGIAYEDGPSPGVWQSGSSGGGAAGTGRTSYWHRVKPRNVALLACIKY
jgi:phage-related tail fiber protein